MSEPPGVQRVVGAGGRPLADVIAARIREVDGSHTMGAGALGEAIADLFKQATWSVEGRPLYAVRNVHQPWRAQDPTERADSLTVPTADAKVVVALRTRCSGEL